MIMHMSIMPMIMPIIMPIMLRIIGNNKTDKNKNNRMIGSL